MSEQTTKSNKTSNSKKSSTCKAYTKEEMALTQDQRTYFIRGICLWIMLQDLLVCGRMVWTSKKDDRRSDQAMSEMYPNTDEGDKLF